MEHHSETSRPHLRRPPLLSSRPLWDTAADAALFTGRDTELSALRRGIHDGLNTLLLGSRGSGKTSVLRRLSWELRDQRAVLLLDGPHVSEPGALLSALAAGLEANQSLGPTGSAASTSVPEALHRVLDQLQACSTDLPTLVLLDSTAPQVAHTLFGRLRDELWRLPLLWVVAADERRRAAYLQPPADAFFDHHVTLRSLTPDEAVLMLRRRLGPQMPTGELAAMVNAVPDPTPRALLAAVRRQRNHHHVDPAAHAQAQARLEELGEPAALLAEELRALGAASASDPALLDALGWSRPRTVQVLRQLHRAGLVSTADVPAGQGGRPQRLYALIQELT